MAGAPPPYPPPYPPPPQGDWRYQRQVLRDQAKAQREASRNQWRAYRDQQRAQHRGLRGGSILGPVILIGLGVLFLLARMGHLDHAAIFFWYGRWWPVILLAGGVVLLAEWAFDRNRPEDQRHAYRGRGGVVTLLLLLCIPGIAISASHGDVNWFSHGISINDDNIDEFLGDRHESEQAIDQTLPTGAALTINNPRGEVIVSGTSEDNQIHVSVHKQVFSRSDSDASSKASQLTATLTNSGSAYTLNLPTVDGAHADLNIRVPATTPVTITVDHGNVTANSIKAAVTLTANHGDVELNAIGGSVTTHINNKGSSFTARSVTGGITLEGDCRDVEIVDVTGAVALNGDFFGKSHLEHIGGGLRFHSSRTDFQLVRLDGEVELSHGELTGDQILGPVSLSTNSENVTLDRVAGDVSITTSNGTVDLTGAPPLGNVTIQNRNGEVNVTVPEQSSFTVQAATRGGDVQTDLPLTRSEDNSTNRLSGSVGTGGSLIRINTTENDISLKKGAISALTGPVALPAPPLPPGPLTLTPPKPGPKPKHSAKPAAPVAPATP